MAAGRSGDGAPPGPRPVTWGWAWLLVLALWWVATLYLGGDLGKLADDWSQHQRDVATGAWDWPPFALPDRFWRPLHLVLAGSLQTVLWEHDRLNHAVSALVHGGCVLLLYRVLREAGCGRRSSMAACLLVLAYPAGWEVVFWPAALSTGVATGVLVMMAGVVVRAARTGARWWTHGMLLVLGFMLCCFNEQPAMVTPALAVLAMACVEAVPRRRAVVRTAGLGAASMAGCAAYAGLYLWTASAGDRGTADAMVPMGELGARLGRFVGLVWARMGLLEFGLPALRLGGERLLDRGPVVLVLVVMVIAVLGWAWSWRWMRQADGSAGESGGRRAWLLVVFGVLGSVLAWVPFLVTARYDAPSRASYLPAVCLAFVLVGVIDAAASRVGGGRRARLTRGVAGACVLVMALVGAVMMVGVQGLLQARYRLDVAQARRLVEAVPDPPAGTVFLPLSMRDRPVDTGSVWFDQQAIGAFRLGWSAPPLVQSAYGRGDITSGACWHQWTRDVVRMDAEGVVLNRRLGGAEEVRPGRYRLGWDRVVPFEIDETGRVLVITRLGDRDDEGLAVEPPIAVEAARAGRCEEHAFVFRAWRGGAR